jgi:two-component system, NarL family, nitrate/nitrite response regulator NarL
MTEHGIDDDRSGGKSVHLAVQSHRRLVREALAFCLSNRSDITVVGHTARCADLVALCATRRTTAAIIDLQGPLPETMAAARQLREHFPQLTLIGLYDEVAPPTLDQARGAGFSAVIAGARGVEALLTTLYEQVGRTSRQNPERPIPSGLSDREQTALWLLRCGHGVHEAADLTDIDVRDVENLKRRAASRPEAQPAGTAGEPAVVAEAATALRQASVPAQRMASADPARALLVVVHGRPGPTVDHVAQTLLRHRLAYVLDQVGEDAPGDGHSRLELPAAHRGPVAVVVIDPFPADWALCESLGAPAVAVHSGQSHGAVAVHALRRGALAAITADHIDDDLVPALNLVARGYVAIDAIRARPLLEVLNSRFEGHWPMELSAREYDILLSVARGESVRQTARSLGIAPKTVENTQARLFRKLGVRNRPGALAAARRLGLLDAARTS